MSRALIFSLIGVALLVGIVWLAPPGSILSAPAAVLGGAYDILSGRTQLTEAPVNVDKQRAGDRASLPEQAAEADDRQSATGVGAPAEPATTTSSTPPGPKPEPKPRTRLSASSIVNVRAGQGTDFQVVGQVAPGETVVQVEDPGGDWVRIRGDDVEGWVYRPLFERVEE